MVTAKRHRNKARPKIIAKIFTFLLYFIASHTHSESISIPPIIAAPPGAAFIADLNQYNACSRLQIGEYGVNANGFTYTVVRYCDSNATEVQAFVNAGWGVYNNCTSNNSNFGTCNAYWPTLPGKPATCPLGYVLSGMSCIRTNSPLPGKNLGPKNCVGNPINAGIGNKYLREDDLSLKNSYISFSRIYNSASGEHESPDNKNKRWRHSYERKILVKDLYGASATAIASRPDGENYYFSFSNGGWISDSDQIEKLFELKDPQGIRTGWRYVNRNEEVELYDNIGKLQSISSQKGFLETLAYTDGTSSSGAYVLDEQGNNTSEALPAGLLFKITDSFGRSTIFGYNSTYLLSKLTTHSGGIYRYFYDSNKNYTEIHNPDSTTKIYKYNEPDNTSGANLPSALTGIIDEKGARFATYKYDAQGRAISSEHNVANGNPVEKVSIAYSTDANSNVTSSSVTDALGTTRNYSFTNILGVVKNTGISQPCSSGCGSASARTYDTNGNTSGKTDFNGNTTNYSYDLTRNLETSRTEAYGTTLARTITTTWHTTYRLPTLITESGKTTSFGYDTAGNLLTKTITDTALSKSRTWTWTYNSLGQVLTADGPRTDVSDITSNTYYTSASSAAGSVHSIGDLATVTNALGQVASITNYDLNGKPLTITDANGVVTTLTYWPRGWLKSRTVNGSQTTTYDYDGAGQLTKVTLPDTSYLSYTYDTAHRLTDIIDNTGNKTHYTLDAMGNRIQEDTKDPSGNILKTRSHIFDALNRLQKDIGGTSPSTQITQYGYDSNGNLKNITDPLNHVTTNGYDALNRLITVTDPANGVATTTYNALDQVTQIKDPRLAATNYTIDALGNVTLTQSPDSGNTQSVFDAAGNVTQKTDARGVVSNYTYDALNRVTSITYPANTAENVTLTYDSTLNSNKGIGRLTFYGNDGGSTVLVYDSYGNITTQTEIIGSQIYATAYVYDNANRIGQITYPSGRIVIYTRNTLGQVTQVQTKDTSASAAVTLLSSASYYPFGPLNTLTYGNGVTSTLQRDADYRVSRITTTSTPAWDFVYSYDAASNISGMADQVSTFSKTFGYDGLDRVTTDTNNVGNWSYQYDANGNRTKRITTTTQTLTYATTSNRMTGNTGTAQTLDAAGNLITNGSKTYIYNNADRLSTYSVSGTIRAQMLYSALGQRTAKLQITRPMHFHYDLGRRFIDANAFNSNGTLYQRFEWIYVDDTPIAQVMTLYGTNNAVSSRRTTYIHADHVNTPRAMTDSTQKIVWRWDGDAYGATVPNQNPDGDSTTNTLNLRFPGQYYDVETALYNNGYRDYDFGTGRYVQSDPIGLEGGLNTYGYVEGNPVNLTDPLGLQIMRPINRLIPRGYPRTRPQTPERQAQREYRKDCDLVMGCPPPELTEEYCEWVCPGDEPSSCPAPGAKLKRMAEDDPRCYCVMKTRTNPQL